MPKILSIFIPAYNMEALLSRCLDSLAAASCLDSLDIIVVNDGSTDGTLKVARSYQDRFPQSIRIVDKPNGNYGSTINAALPLAVGEYSRILDSDDWFDTKALERHVSSLEALHEPVDVSVTHFRSILNGGRTEIVRYNVYGREPFEYEKVLRLDDVLASGVVRFFLMHSLTYRTELLRAHGYRQTEGISYTDIEWSIFPIYHAETIVFHDIVVYQYCMDRAGQTMDPQVVSRSLPQLEKMTISLIDHYRNFDLETLSEAKHTFLRSFLRNRIRLLCKAYLVDLPRESFDSAVFAAVQDRFRAAAKGTDIPEPKLFPTSKYIRFDIYAYWNKHYSRLPSWLEKTFSAVDAVSLRVYSLLFRR
jgi:Glycosyltransferases involved in cell wall biogenesis